VVTNLETREPLWFGGERKQETLDEFFEKQLSAFQRSAIRAACVDMMGTALLTKPGAVGNIKSLLRRGRGDRDMNDLLLKAQRLAATRTEFLVLQKAA